MIIINFKNYLAGHKSLELAKKIERHLPDALITVSAVDVGYLGYYLPSLKIYAQHVDYQKKGKTSGYLIPEALKAHGAEGTLLNHAEHRIDMSEIRKTVKRCKKEGLKVIVCVQTHAETKKVMKMKPYGIAFEDKKLIGSGRSITSLRSDDIRKFSEMLKYKNIIAICGAGVSTREDVLASRELGCKGVLISSAIAASRKPDKLLRELSEI